MKFKIILTLLTLVLVSLLSFSNRCGQTCDGRAYLSAEAPAVSRVADAVEAEASEDESAHSPFLRMAVTL